MSWCRGLVAIVAGGARAGAGGIVTTIAVGAGGCDLMFDVLIEYITADEDLVDSNSDGGSSYTYKTEDDESSNSSGYDESDVELKLKELLLYSVVLSYDCLRPHHLIAVLAFFHHLRVRRTQLVTFTKLRPMYSILRCLNLRSVVIFKCSSVVNLSLKCCLYRRSCRA
jgi:hypothetical protein